MLRASAAERNVGPIADVLGKYLTSGMKVLEIASGTGQHCIGFAKKFPDVIWQPSEMDARSLHSIVGYVDHNQLSNVRVPLFIDAAKELGKWALPEEFRPKEVDCILNVNMIHISSDAAVTGLFKASSQLLKDSVGLLVTYGPYAMNGRIFPESNVTFDRNLREQNDQWGLRDVDYLRRLASSEGLRLAATHDMPANNHMLVFCKD